MAPRRLIAPALMAATLVLVGCAEEPETGPPVQLIGAQDGLPVLAYEIPLLAAEDLVEVVWEGEGPELVPGGTVLLDFYAENATDGSVIGETFTSEPRAYRLTATALGEDLVAALTGQRVGTRLLQVVPASADAPDPVVAVLDVRPTRATGEPVQPRDGLPRVALAGDGTPAIDIPATAAPSDLVIQPLVRGAGAQVRAGQVVTVQYRGVTWSTGEEFDSTWGEEGLPAAFPIGVGSVIPGWDEGLVEQTVGSQVLLVVPPAMGYGGTAHELAAETLVFVIDILAASGGPDS